MIKNKEQDIKDYIEENIHARVESSSQGSPNNGLWFQKLEPEGHFVGGDKHSVYKAQYYSNRTYFNQIFP